MHQFLDFEKPLADLSGKIEELRRLPSSSNLNIGDEISRLQIKADKLKQQIYGNLTPWQKVQLARSSARPKFLNYWAKFSDALVLAGDRTFGDDQSIIGGLVTINDQKVMVIGQEKGHDTESRVKHSFGMPKPEGYRKAQRLMLLANRFNLPVVTFIDTPGASPGIEAEERGQAQAIAKSIEVSLNLEVPLITVILGEGSSGGAIAIASANEVLMLEHAIYSVISPEGCASILWKSRNRAIDAADAQKLTAQDLLKLGIIDKIIPEPIGGAHQYPEIVINNVLQEVANSLTKFKGLPGAKIKQIRREKFLNMGKIGL